MLQKARVRIDPAGHFVSGRWSFRFQKTTLFVSYGWSFRSGRLVPPFGTACCSLSDGWLFHFRRAGCFLSDCSRFHFISDGWSFETLLGDVCFCLAVVSVNKYGRLMREEISKY